MNCTYFDALGGDNNAYLIARAIQFFVPGVPQLYYVGLFGGSNDMELLKTTNVGRDINRHYFSKSEIMAYVATGLFKNLRRLMCFRNEHPAFNGNFELLPLSNKMLGIRWSNNDHWAQLRVDLEQMEMEIAYSDNEGKEKALFGTMTSDSVR